MVGFSASGMKSSVTGKYILFGVMLPLGFLCFLRFLKWYMYYEDIFIRG